MKISSFYTLAFLSFFAFTFTSCEDEPLEGDFINFNPDGAVASFTANVDGVVFTATSSMAVSSDNSTRITGVKNNGDIMELTYNSTGAGSFSLTFPQGEANFGINMNADLFSSNNTGMGGNLVVTNYNAQNGLISGTFSFTASWPLEDANGQPILDNAGNPTFQIIDVTEGQFNNVPLTGGTDNPNPNNGQFSALVDGNNFNADGPNSAAVYLSGANRITLVGMQNDNSYIQIIVENAGVGQFELPGTFENQSSGVYGVENQSMYTTMEGFGGSGTINITHFDLASKKMSGTFEFIAVNETGDNVNVTNGVFTDIYIETEIPGDGVSTLSADIDGAAFNPNAITTNVPDGEHLNILALHNASGKTISLIFPLDMGVGNHNFNFIYTDEYAQGTYMPVFGQPLFYTSISGTLTITGVGANTRTGTFEFQAEDMSDDNSPIINITNGTFSVTF